MTVTLHQPLAGGNWGPEHIESAEPIKYEIVDGNLVLMSPMKSRWHQTVIRELVQTLHQAAPEGYSALAELTITYFRPGAVRVTMREPDVVVLLPEAKGGRENTFDPREVALVVEVESPSTKAIDRKDKVDEYARAGILCYWRVEQVADDAAIVHVYEVDPGTGEYNLVRSIGPKDKFMVPKPYATMVDPSQLVADLAS